MTMIEFEFAGRAWRLSTEHPTSSYGIPVLVDDANKSYALREVAYVVGNCTYEAGAVAMYGHDANDAEHARMYKAYRDQLAVG